MFENFLGDVLPISVIQTVHNLVKNCILELSDSRCVPEAFYKVLTFESGGTLPVSGQG